MGVLDRFQPNVRRAAKRVSGRAAVTGSDGALRGRRRRPAAGEARHRDAWGIEFSRIVAFSDGVFAIAITLLVLQIHVPAHLPAGDTLFDEILGPHGDFIAYGISFAVLGKLWLAHHRFFAAVERFDPC